MRAEHFFYNSSSLRCVR